MVKKKVKKKVSKKSKKNKKGTPKALNQEDRQLFWFFALIILVFASFLVPYFYIQNTKSFEFNHIEWFIEEEPTITLYHGQFQTLSGVNNIHSIYLRQDPRENDVRVDGKIDDFIFGTLFSFGPTIDVCGGELSRAVFDFSDFMRNGVGVSDLKIATTDFENSISKNLTAADCSTHPEFTVVTFELSSESRIERSKENPNCYMVYFESCEDISPIEKFMVRAVNDFRERKLADDQ